LDYSDYSNRFVWFFLDQLSDRAERFILNGQSFDPLKGDGIVPSSNQIFNGIGRDVNSYYYSGLRHSPMLGTLMSKSLSIT
jgi:hypothetical protein